MRIAAIDIGTNSIHVVVAEAGAHGSFDVLDREREVVQVGRGSFLGGRLRSDAIARTAESLARFVALARSLGAERIVCTATAAVREAKNGGEFVRAARQAAGITPRVIPAREEGRLIWLGVRSALELPDEPVLLLDIGGGSLQLVVCTREKLLKVVSLPLGALRLNELKPLGDPPDPTALARLTRHVRRTIEPVIAAIAAFAPVRAYGSSGSIHALAHVLRHLDGGPPLRHINGRRLERKGLERATRTLEGMALSERLRLPGLDAARAEILIPGAIVLVHALRAFDMDELTISDFGVREGLLADYIARHAKEIERLDPVEDLKLRSVFRLLARFRGDEAHARHVTALAMGLFDELRREHELDDEARRLLQYAGLLHDIGSVIGHDDHTEHSYYIIRNGNLRGLSADEVEIVATVARYHGKARPRKRDRAFATLTAEEQNAVRWMAALLRIAEALDRSQYQLVRGVRVTHAGTAVTIHAAAREDARLEVWAARQRTRLLARLLDRPVRVVLETAQVTPTPPRAQGSSAGRAATPSAAPRRRARAAARGSAPARTARRPATAASSGRAKPAAPRGHARSRGSAARGATPRAAADRPGPARPKGRPRPGPRKRTDPS